MRKKTLGCRCPSLERCLHCERSECDVICGVPQHRSEIIALINAGMLPMRALYMHDMRQGKLRKITKTSRIEVCDREQFDNDRRT